MRELTVKDYRDALLIQDAVNLTAVAQSFADVTKKILHDVGDTKDVWRHPISVLYASKFASLTNCEATFVFSHAYEKAKAYAEIIVDKPTS